MLFLSDFHITEWLEDHVDPVPTEGESLSYIPQTLLLDDLGLTLFTLEPACEHPDGTDRWINGRFLFEPMNVDCKCLCDKDYLNHIKKP